MPERSEERELSALESALRELRPKTEAIDRAVLMYRAGRASARGWVWPMATMLSTAVALVLGIALWIRPAPSVVYVSVPPLRSDEDSSSPPAPPHADDLENGGWSRYLDLQEQVLNYGLDGLPSLPQETKDSPLGADELWNSF